MPPFSRMAFAISHMQTVCLAQQDVFSFHPNPGLDFPSFLPDFIFLINRQITLNPFPPPACSYIDFPFHTQTRIFHNGKTESVPSVGFRSGFLRERIEDGRNKVPALPYSVIPDV